ncbi:MAG TPA: glycosyltransferase family 39 protein [Candidatus Hydrogenedentes bacterium]|nr:glycosyltransferase family 39 protein [Candidatus Hydrogenedentota bacterium]
MESHSQNNQRALSFAGGRITPLLVVAGLTLLVLVPFAGKPFNMDDPVYLWVARHILQHPADFFGFNCYWTYTEKPMHEINMNPPGVSYFIAPIIGLFGEREVPIHLALLIPAVAASLGGFYLARSLCKRPLFAAVLSIISPVFAVSGTMVMSDMLMFAFFIWAIVLWREGWEHRDSRALALGGLLIALAVLTKYSALMLIPLLGIYSIFHARKIDVRLLYMVIPIVLIAGYQWYTHHLYGKAMLSEAGNYAMLSNWRENHGFITRPIITLGFLGGCLAPVLFFAPLTWSWRVLLTSFCAAFCGAALVTALHRHVTPLVMGADRVHWGLLAQWAVYIMGGILLCLAVLQDIRRNRDAVSFFLFLWIAGVFSFAAFVNWTVAARNILPAAPAMAILLVRRLDETGQEEERLWRIAWPVIPAAALALCISWSDYALAGINPVAARKIAAEAKKANAENVLFYGHWGFQYYMEKEGAKPVDCEKPSMKNGDWVAIPENNTGVVESPSPWAVPIFTLKVPGCSWLSTMQYNVGAGLHSSSFGPLPFVFGRIPVSSIRVFQIHTGESGT